MNKRLLLIIVIFQLINNSDLVGQELEIQMDRLLSRNINLATPGGSIAVIRGGNIEFSKSYGLANLSHKIPFSEHTVSDIGSVAKQITCYAILQLEQAGKLSIEDDIRNYFEAIPDFGETIKIKHLMSHTSGLREIYGMRAVAGGRSGDAILQSDALRLVEFSEELNFPPGSQYNYCNTAYMLLADIVAKTSGLSFEDYMQSHVFKPLGMYQTFIMDNQGEWYMNQALSYAKNSESNFLRIFDNSTVQGAGGIYTTMQDLIKWAQHIVSPPGHAEGIITKMKTPFTLNDGTILEYGFGLDVGQSFKMEAFGHTGSSAGYRAYFKHFVPLELSIIIKTNRPDFPTNDVIQTILEHYSDAPLIQAGNPASDQHDLPANFELPNHRKLLGQYYSAEASMNYEIIEQSGKLYARSLRNGDIELNQTGNISFKSDTWYFSEIHFEYHKGSVTGFRLNNGRVNNLWFKKMN